MNAMAAMYQQMELANNVYLKLPFLPTDFGEPAVARGSRRPADASAPKRTKFYSRMGHFKITTTKSCPSKNG